MKEPWWSYDEISDVYASVAEQIYFAAPARDLISLLELRASDQLLDVGTGSGIVAAEAQRLSPASRVIGCDPAIPMLRVARGRGVTVLAAGLPRLPFAPESFHAASAAFVLSHIPDTSAALLELRRVLTVGGRLVLTSWSTSAGTSAPGRLWESAVNESVSSAALSKATEHALPAEGRLSILENLTKAMNDARFASVKGEERTYTVEVATDQFVRSRLVSMSARYLRSRLSSPAWHTFVTEATDCIRNQFGETLRFETSVNFVRGCRDG